MLVHFGHAQFIKADFPILYVEIKDNTDLTELLEKSLNSINNYKKIGLVSSIQHMHKIEDVKKYYENEGKDVSILQKLESEILPSTSLKRFRIEE